MRIFFQLAHNEKLFLINLHDKCQSLMGLQDQRNAENNSQVNHLLLLVPDQKPNLLSNMESSKILQ